MRWDESAVFFCPCDALETQIEPDFDLELFDYKCIRPKWCRPDFTAYLGGNAPECAACLSSTAYGRRIEYDMICDTF